MSNATLTAEKRGNQVLTREQIQELAAETVRNEGILLARELQKGDNYDGGNLVALLEVFANKLDAAKSPEIVGVIDAKLGDGWTRKLAQNLR